MLAQDPLLRVCAVTTLISSALYVMLFLASRVVSWHWFAGYRRLPSHLRVDWDTRVPSTVHALVVTAVCTWELVRGNKLSAAVTGGTPGLAGPVLQQATATLPLVWRVSQTTYGIIGVSFAYFAVDLAVILRNPRISRCAVHGARDSVPACCGSAGQQHHTCHHTCPARSPHTALQSWYITSLRYCHWHPWRTHVPCTCF